MLKGFGKVLCVVMAGILPFFACKKNKEETKPDTDNTVDRRTVLANISDNIIIPGYTHFRQELDSMKVQADLFISNPDPVSLNSFRQAWIKAYTSWQKVELYEVGPAQEITLRSFMNIYPANAAVINSNINNPSADLELPVNSSAQGFPALDYLLNGLGNDQETVEKYTTAQDAAARKAYLQKLVNRMKELTDRVVTAWPAYRDKFVSSTSLDAGSSMSVLVNNYVMYFEKYIRTGKIGIPSGAMTVPAGSQVFPDRAEAFYKKDISVTLAKTAVQSTADFFNGRSFNTGAEGPSFRSYLDALDAKDGATGTSLSSLINAQFTTISSRLNGLNNNLAEQVSTNNAPVLETYSQMQALVRMLKVDMTSAMSVTITYTDTDGD